MVPPAEVTAWVQASCAAQGIPVKVTDVTVIRRVGVLLGALSGGFARAPAKREHASPPVRRISGATRH
jgi:hypothetical protein